MASTTSIVLEVTSPTTANAPFHSAWSLTQMRKSGPPLMTATTPRRSCGVPHDALILATCLPTDVRADARPWTSPYGGPKGELLGGLGSARYSSQAPPGCSATLRQTARATPGELPAYKLMLMDASAPATLTFSVKTPACAPSNRQGGASRGTHVPHERAHDLMAFQAQVVSTTDRLKMCNQANCFHARLHVTRISFTLASVSPRLT